MSNYKTYEYIWLDGYQPEPSMRSKVKATDDNRPPDWSFDGSSTQQAEGGSSDCLLLPVQTYENPHGHDIVMTQVQSADHTTHPTNFRAAAAEVVTDDWWFGFEQEYFNKNLNAEVIGTDISDTASNFENTVEWDFHDKRDDWVDKFDFIYTNSLDQSWNPKLALTTWLDQVHNNGIVFIEHTERHGPVGTSSMDPFGVKPRVMPYVLTKWFGNKISIKIIKSKKPNLNIPVWVFAVKRNY